MSDLAERFYRRVLPRENGCHEWQGYVARNGYGQIGAPGRKVLYTHRLAWVLAKSDPGDAYVLHTCDNRRCVNPDHLFLGTFDDNMADMVRKGRQARGERNGHAKLTAEQAAEIKVSNERTSILAKRYSVAAPTICDVRSGRNWSHV